MAALVATILAAVGFVLDGTGSRTSRWDSPQALGLAVLALIALHLAAGSWPRKP